MRPPAALEGAGNLGKDVDLELRRDAEMVVRLGTNAGVEEEIFLALGAGQAIAVDPPFFIIVDGSEDERQSPIG